MRLGTGKVAAGSEGPLYRFDNVCRTADKGVALQHEIMFFKIK